MPRPSRTAFRGLALAASLVVAVAGSLALLDTARLVDVLIALAGAFGAGAAIAAWLAERPRRA